MCNTSHFLYVDVLGRLGRILVGTAVDLVDLVLTSWAASGTTGLRVQRDCFHWALANSWPTTHSSIGSSEERKYALLKFRDCGKQLFFYYLLLIIRLKRREPSSHFISSRFPPQFISGNDGYLICSVNQTNIKFRAVLRTLAPSVIKHVGVSAIWKPRRRISENIHEKLKPFCSELLAKLATKLSDIGG